MAAWALGMAQRAEVGVALEGQGQKEKAHRHQGQEDPVHGVHALP
jgi:hypothetical protein